MRVEQKKWSKKDGWEDVSKLKNIESSDLVLVFGARSVITQKDHFSKIKSFYPKASIIIASTAGEILGTSVDDNTISVSAIKFKKTKIKTAQTTISNSKNSKKAGITLAKKIPTKGLVHCLIFSDGILVNGSDLVSGLVSQLPKNVSITGGLMGDGANFKETVIGLDELPKKGNIVIVGLYGKSLQVSYGSLGGWDTFGHRRLITKSEDNVLYELDDKPVLDLYKEYLGQKAKDLPGSGLFFPLSLDIDGTEVVRTLLAVNEKDKSITFAGNMPEGVYAKMMKANFDRLVDGAAGAAIKSKEMIKKNKAQFALLISCVGRKLVLKDRIEEETEAVQSILGKKVPLAGFYSYGEICPTAPTNKKCRLHNQTMTITTFTEGE